MNAKRKSALHSLAQTLDLNLTNLEILDLALTHTSYANEIKASKAYGHNQRLEFLGDSVLSLVVSTYIYKTYPSKAEGELSKLRAFLVCENTLAMLAKEIDLGSYLLLGKGEIALNGAENPSILADAFEAVVAATYLDQGFAAANKLLSTLLLTKIPQLVKAGFNLDYKTSLQEAVQKHGPVEIKYEELASEGPSHARTFFVRVLVRGKEYGKGQGHSKKEAEQQAAKCALTKIKNS